MIHSRVTFFGRILLGRLLPASSVDGVTGPDMVPRISHDRAEG